MRPNPFASGRSVAVGIMHREGIHWSEFSCGWPSKEAALAAANVPCDSSHREYIQDCIVGRFWKEDGTPTDLDEE